MPIYEYRCPSCGHTTKRLMRYDERHDPVDCGECGSSTEWVFPVPHCLPDGVYSYAPNVGDPSAHERKNEKIKANREAKLEREGC